MKYTLQYRDGANYKFQVTASINKELKEGDTITMQELGYTQQQFFEEHIMYEIDEEVDHNILDVIGILPNDSPVDIE